jgi:hypothetical protein
LQSATAVGIAAACWPHAWLIPFGANEQLLQTGSTCGAIILWPVASGRWFVAGQRSGR